ncbi:MAG: hypothetical protein KDA75_11390 [Planctomycetaceae bacterium]|nr:hypothetical protein [Planctomycetaceae bacterium]
MKWCVTSLAVGILVVARTADADDPPGSRPEDAQAVWTQLYTRQASQLRAVLDGQEKAPLALHPQPLLNYENPVRIYDQHGSAYVWLDAGRVAMVGAIWSGLRADLDESVRFLSREGHNLTTRALEVSLEGDSLWTCPAGEVERHRIAEAPRSQRFARLSQMRSIAQGLDVKMHAPRSDLRLLTQPVYRYSDSAESVEDGALFTWVMGTDPEVFALIEAFEDHFELVVARFTNEVISIRRDGQEIYRCGYIDSLTNRGPYWLAPHIEVMPLSPSEAAVSGRTSP